MKPRVLEDEKMSARRLPVAKADVPPTPVWSWKSMKLKVREAIDVPTHKDLISSCYLQLDFVGS